MSQSEKNEYTRRRKTLLTSHALLVAHIVVATVYRLPARMPVGNEEGEAHTNRNMARDIFTGWAIARGDAPPARGHLIVARPRRASH